MKTEKTETEKRRIVVEKKVIEEGLGNGLDQGEGRDGRVGGGLDQLDSKTGEGRRIRVGERRGEGSLYLDLSNRYFSISPMWNSRLIEDILQE